MAWKGNETLDISTREGTVSFIYWERNKLMDIQVDGKEYTMSINDAWDLLDFLK